MNEQAEAGTRLHVSNTRQLKPSQRCAACWEIVPKTLEQRTHVCPHCGHTAQRDQNAASVVLIDAHMPGTGVAARPKPLSRQRAKSKSVTRETPAAAPKGLDNFLLIEAVGEFIDVVPQILHAPAQLPSERRINRTFAVTAMRLLLPLLLLGRATARELADVLDLLARRTYVHRPAKTRPRPTRPKPHKFMAMKTC